ncbi:MAG: T9SS type A sorting domain-containing protein [Flavobacteriales bacterium]|nr:T9SS type A sorting domain-containing protein [Flavobacteriales bacterium]NNK80212.1 T9SS type A sorting domain-containing protein [Flavobacteriales bacterium]
MRILTIISSILLTIKLSAQCYPDRHNTNWFDGWTSCETTTGPISQYGESHWIQYDLGYQYLLGEMKLWNLNDPAHLDRGVNEINIDISEDGESWTNLGSYNVPIASGFSIYEGEEILDFNEAQARYVLITVGSSHGAACAGFSELKINIEGVVTDVSEFETPEACFDVAIYPNPHTDIFNARIRTQCGGLMTVQLHDAMGRLVQDRQLSGLNPEEQLVLGSAELPAGIYYLSVQQEDALGRYQIVKTR